MGLVLRVPHVSMPSGATISATKLTLAQMDNNFIFLQNLISGLTSITVAEAVDLRDNSQVVIGQTYLITDADPYLYGTYSSFGFGDGTSIILEGIDTNKFSSNGYGKFYNPKYSDHDVYNSYNSYSEGDIVIYGGRVWQRLSEGDEGTNGYLSLNNAWTPLSYIDSSYYNVVWDEIEYDFDNNFICARYDAANNNFVKNNYDVQFFNCELYPIQGFRWGHNILDGGVANCTIINAYFGCLNYVSGQIVNITLSNYCVISNINLYNNSYINNINMQNYCSLQDIYLWNSSIYNIKMENNCGMQNININDDAAIEYENPNISYISNVSLINNSIIHDIYLEPSQTNAGTYFDNISLTNECTINNIYLGSINNDCYFSEITIVNDSEIVYITAYESDFSNINISTDSILAGNYNDTFSDNSSFSYINLTNQSFILGDYETDDAFTGDGSIYFDSATFENVSLTNNSIFTGPFEMNSNSSIDNLSMDYGYFGGRDQDSGDNFGIYLESSNIDNLLIERYSWISNLDMYSSTLSNSRLSNYSRISSDGDSVLLNNSTLDYINVSNHSYIGYDRVEILNSNWYDVLIENDSKIGGYIYFDTAHFGVISLKNNSKIWGDFDDIYINTANMHYISLDNHSEITGYISIDNGSNIHNITLDSSYLGGYNYNFFINNSNFNFINLTNNSYITAENDDITINDNSYFEYVSLDNNSYINGYLQVGEGSTFRNINLTNESYIESINIWDNSEIVDVDIKNNSYLSNIYPQNYSSMRYITINNYSRFTGDIYLYNSGTKVYYLDIKNYSYIDAHFDIENGSEIKYIDLNNHSHITGNLYMYSSSKIKRVQMANYSKISGNNYMYSGSEIQYMSMLNVSDNSGTSCYGPGFTNFYINSSLLHGLNMEWSTLGGLYMSDNTKMQGITIENSSVLNIDIETNSGFYNSKIYNSYIDGDSPFGGIFIHGDSNIENLIIDTTDFPTWNSGNFGLAVANESTVRNMTLKNLSLNNRIFIRENSISNIDGLFQNFVVMNGSYVEHFNTEAGETYDGGSDNWDGGYVQGVDIINGSYISNFNAKNGQVDTISLDGDNHLYNININNAGFYDINLRNNSYIDNFNTNNTTGVYTIYLDAASNITGLDNNNSNVNNIQLNNSSLYSIKLNNSYLQTLSLTGSEISIANFNLGSFNNLNINTSVLSNSNLDGAQIQNYNPIDTVQNNFNLSNINFNYNGATNSTLKNTLVQGNTIKYQFTIDLANANGTINIPTVLIPSAGWYFEKVLFDNTEIISSGSTTLSMGMTSHLECVLNDVDITTLSNAVKLYDLNNFNTPGSKSNGVEEVVIFTSGDAITSGTMGVEITFKNITYSVDWFM